MCVRQRDFGVREMRVSAGVSHYGGHDLSGLARMPGARAVCASLLPKICATIEDEVQSSAWVAP